MPRQSEFGKRLSAAADFVRAGAVFADIGTDHASLPIYLASLGKVKSAYACDVAEKPVELARKNVDASGYSDIIEVRLTDGFSGLEGVGLTDAAVCGMGGELISALLSADCARFLRADKVRLILQPMSRSSYLRHYLASEGFEIEDEIIVRDMGRQYEIICAVYTGVPYTLTPVEEQLGRDNIKRGGDELAVLCKRRLLHLKNLLGGTQGAEREETLGLIKMLEETQKEVLK